MPLYMVYAQILHRIRNEKTNYKKRRGMLMGRHNFISVFISNQNTQVQILKPEIAGDKVLASSHSRYLVDKGWKGSCKNIPAAYLTGYIAGKKALAAGVSNAILYSGTRSYTQRMAASLKGIIDAGIAVNADSETFPSQDRIDGKHLTVKNNVGDFKNIIDGDIK
ncbi:MAG: 50S ribosomal protein L18 [Candidatus Nitrosoabyssus spongiisocia]|nr:MAG: 50S ribosomal protein L18 [Nitrosopumilaceae archaeon AB1(1)]